MQNLQQKNERGFFLLEALVALLVFSVGILGMVSLNALAVQAKSDATYRTEAARFAEDIANRIVLNVDRSNEASLQTSLATFAHQPTGSCSEGFSGTASTVALVTAWVDRVRAATSGLPGASTASVQIIVDLSATEFNRLSVTVCWQAPSDKAVRSHTLTTYIN